MGLSRTDRLILANQYRLLALLDKPDADTYNKYVEILREGFETEYSHFFQEIDEDILISADAHEVFEVMNMFRALKYGYQNLDDKSGIDSYPITFHGFSGNDEGKQWAYAQYLQANQRYTDIGEGDLNSHSPEMDTYRRMLPEWQKSADKFELTKEDIQRILAVRIHPSNRKPAE